MVFHHGFPSWFSIMVFHHGFPSWFSIMVFHHGFPSWFSIMVFHHGFPSWLSIMVFHRGELRQGFIGSIGTQGHDPNCKRAGREISSSCSHLLAGTAKVPVFFHPRAGT